MTSLCLESCLLGLQLLFSGYFLPVFHSLELRWQNKICSYIGLSSLVCFTAGLLSSFYAEDCIYHFATDLRYFPIETQRVPVCVCKLQKMLNLHFILECFVKFRNVTNIPVCLLYLSTNSLFLIFVLSLYFFFSQKLFIQITYFAILADI